MFWKLRARKHTRKLSWMPTADFCYTRENTQTLKEDTWNWLKNTLNQKGSPFSGVPHGGGVRKGFFD